MRHPILSGPQGVSPTAEPAWRWYEANSPLGEEHPTMSDTGRHTIVPQPPHRPPPPHPEWSPSSPPHGTATAG